MPSHPDRIRNNYSVCFHTGKHEIEIPVLGSDFAPFINDDGTRTTHWICSTCGEKRSYSRSQAEFEAELNKLLKE